MATLLHIDGAARCLKDAERALLSPEYSLPRALHRTLSRLRPQEAADRLATDGAKQLPTAAPAHAASHHHDVLGARRVGLAARAVARTVLKHVDHALAQKRQEDAAGAPPPAEKPRPAGSERRRHDHLGRVLGDGRCVLLWHTKHRQRVVNQRPRERRNDLLLALENPVDATPGPIDIRRLWHLLAGLTEFTNNPLEVPANPLAGDLDGRLDGLADRRDAFAEFAARAGGVACKKLPPHLNGGLCQRLKGTGNEAGDSS